MSLIHHEFSHVGSQDSNSWRNRKHKHFLPSKWIGHWNESSVLTLVRGKKCLCCAFWDNSNDNDGVTETDIQKKKKSIWNTGTSSLCVCLVFEHLAQRPNHNAPQTYRKHSSSALRRLVEADASEGRWPPSESSKTLQPLFQVSGIELQPFKPLN